ncbi:autotransporter family protein [Sulfitobacter sp. JL08]|uniref:autotransporter family protein n=1 Tax=Sulfitobacter sp. JL08 TaxID=2070369 RepID=UPI0013B4479F|nr:autotransporter outer membrane beta-barrel domain-containing protein [Sulfitobacter sp. JL08]
MRDNSVDCGARLLVSLFVVSFSPSSAKAACSPAATNGPDTIVCTGNTSSQLRARGGDDTVTISAGSTNTARIALNGGDDTFVLDGNLQARLEGGSGDDTAWLNIGSSIVGQLFMGSASDSINVAAGADISGVTRFDGGDGPVDTITFQGVSAGISGAIVLNWENIILDGGTLSFGPTLSTSSVAGNGLILINDATLNAAGGFSLTGNLSNSGIVSMNDGTAGDISGVSADYAGGGQLFVDVDFATDTSDTLVIGGNVTGAATAVTLTNASTGVETGNDILVIDVAGTTALGDFTLSGGAYSVGAFRYNLDLQGSQWFLSNIGANGTGAVYEAAPDALLRFSSIPTLDQRVSQRQSLGKANSSNSTSPAEGAWLRIHGRKFDIAPQQSTSGNTYDGNIWGVQIGVDTQSIEGGNGHWVFGLTGQFGKLDSTAANGLGSGNIYAEGYGIGATATWYADQGSYLDAQAQINWIDSEISSSTSGSLVNGHSSTAYALSIEGGHRIKMGSQNALIPQAQLTWGHLDGGRFTDTAGDTVNLGSTESLLGRIGLAYEYEYDGASSGTGSSTAGPDQDRKRVYVIGNILHDFSGTSSVNVSGANLSAKNESTWAELGVGGSIVWDENMALFAEGSYRTEISGNLGNNQGVGLTAGFRMTW